MQLKLIGELFKLVRWANWRSMALFTQVNNPITGQKEWKARGENYDYHQEIANAGFGDMLHDTERNQKFYAALRKTITKMHGDGREVHVLDIGTGTGILSMMAVLAGADSVTACEAFLPMANCAERILYANGMSKQVHLVKKRSTEIKVGIGLDMSRRANLLVTEVLDTELIGEGAIGIYNHAHQQLLTDDVVCIPSRATCYAQVAQSALAMQWNSMKILVDLDGEPLLAPTNEMLECKGETGLHDVQLSQLPLELFHPLTKPIEIFHFDFNTKAPRKTERRKDMRVRCCATGSTDLVFYWWDIKMDLEGDIVLSCAPYWSHPQLEQFVAAKTAQVPLPNAVPWRDHWMQAIYYIPRPFHLHTKGSELILSCNHDEYSLWFDAFPIQDLDTDGSSFLSKTVRHACTCGLHMTYSRNRIGQLNQSQRNKRYLRHLEEITSIKDAHVLSLGDGCLLGLATAKLGAATVVCHEPHRFSRRFMESLVQGNSLDNVRIVDKLEAMDQTLLTQLTHIVAEPYFLNSILPWDNFYFGTLLCKIRDRVSSSIHITPHAAHIYAVPVEFLDLHKIRTPIRECEGFNLSLFDEMVKTSATLTHARVEAQPLWEYPGRALALPQKILEVEFHKFTEDKETSGTINIEANGACNGIALWVDWLLDGSSSSKSVVSTGPAENIVSGQYIKWDMFVRQGVQLLGNAQEVRPRSSTVRWITQFKPLMGQLQFHFDIST